MLELDTTASNLFGVGGDFKMIAHAKKPYSEINVCCPGGNRSIQTERLSLLPFQNGLKFLFQEGTVLHARRMNKINKQAGVVFLLGRGSFFPNNSHINNPSLPCQGKRVRPQLHFLPSSTGIGPSFSLIYHKHAVYSDVK